MLGTYSPALGNSKTLLTSSVVSLAFCLSLLAFFATLEYTPPKVPEKEVEVSFVDRIEIPKQIIKKTPISPITSGRVQTSRASRSVKTPTKITKLSATFKKVSYGGAGTDNDVVSIGDSGEPPIFLANNRLPVYPLQEKASGIQDLVILKLVIDASGNVIDIKVIKGKPTFVDAAIKVIKTWKYKPGEINGVAVSCYHIVKIPFKIV